MSDFKRFIKDSEDVQTQIGTSFKVAFLTQNEKRRKHSCSKHFVSDAGAFRPAKKQETPSHICANQEALHLPPRKLLVLTIAASSCRAVDRNPSLLTEIRVCLLFHKYCIYSSCSSLLLPGRTPHVRAVRVDTKSSKYLRQGYTYFTFKRHCQVHLQKATGG